MGNDGWRYVPGGDVAQRFLDSDAFVRGIRGPIGSGKSTACVMDIIRRARAQEADGDGRRRTRWAVIRNTFPELKTTTIKTWHEWTPRDYTRFVESGPPTHWIVDGDLDVEIIFLALDTPGDISKLLSLELTGAWINEAREVPEAVLRHLMGRVGRFPKKTEGFAGASWSGVIMDTNPPDTDHWWYRLAEEQTPSGFEFFAQPSGLSPKAENIAHLPTGYYTRLKDANEHDPDWRQVYIDGEYGFVREGKPVWAMYRDQIHCVDSLKPIVGLPIRIGQDYGLTPAAVLGQRDVSGRWIVFDELVATDMGISRFADLLATHLRENYPGFEYVMTGDPAGDKRAQTDETTPFQVLQAKGFKVVPAPTNDVVLRVEAVSKHLNSLVDGTPGLRISKNCKVLRKAMGGAYCYRRLQVTGKEMYRDVPEKNAYSHVADALQYAMLGAGEGNLLIKAHKPNAWKQPNTKWVV